MAGDKLLFQHVVYTGDLPVPSGGELWVSDGTTDGTKQIATFTGDAHPDLSGAAVAGDDMYFQVYAYASFSPPTLWVSDGTSDGTHAVAGKDGATVPLVSGFTIVAAGDAAYFTTVDIAGASRSSGPRSMARPVLSKSSPARPAARSRRSSRQ